ncbi:MAG: GGDEF domain-containing protein [Planctomycetota bacterium]
MREEDHREGFLSALTDAETGLFDGPFATFKLDEEFKRATRFHQPLSLVLLDCGIVSWPEDPTDRSLVLAEVASIFLSECRDIDTLARFTETEFLFLLPGTGVDGATAVARRMLEQLRSHRYSVEIELDPVVGLATVPASGISDKREFLERAVSCLAAARSGAGEAGLCASCE